MKVLLEENLDHRLRKNLGGHEVFTVIYKGWAGLKNGEVLRAAQADGIEVFLTGDQTLVYEQSFAERKLAVVGRVAHLEKRSSRDCRCSRESCARIG